MSQMFGQLPQITVASVIDILLVALIIYQFLVLIRGTRAVPILVGVGGLALAFYVAHVAELRTVNFLVGTLLPYGIFALIVTGRGTPGKTAT